MTELKVLVVDDDEAVRDSLQALLESDGMLVETFSSGPDFLAAYQDTDVGCLLLDVQMPDMNGLEVQGRLASAGANIPVVVVTGHGDVPMAVQALKAGASDFIEKPFTDDVILGSVRRAIAQGRRTLKETTLVVDTTRRVARLTPREHEVLEQLVTGRPNKVIAFEVGISPRTVEIHRARVMEKMAARSLSQLVRMALAVGIDPVTQ